MVSSGAGNGAVSLFELLDPLEHAIKMRGKQETKIYIR